jgi:sugar phosphate isomerase/epimerase
MQEIATKVHAHMPYHLLPKYLEMFLQTKINPEIYFHHWVLENLDKTRCRDIARRLADAALKVTFHAPFMDLRPGALDEKIRQATVDRIKQVFDIASYFNPIKIVCHASFDERYYVFGDDLWLESSVKTWKDLIAMAKDVNTTIALENVYEKNPDILRRLFDVLSSDRICFCFDTGHFNVFSHEPLTVWLKALGKYLGHLHLHDNFGQRDEHLPVGNGTFPFEELFSSIKKMKAKPSITLEAHNPKNLSQSLENVRSMELLKFLQ